MCTFRIRALLILRIRGINQELEEEEGPERSPVFSSCKVTSNLGTNVTVAA